MAMRQASVTMLAANSDEFLLLAKKLFYFFNLLLFIGSSPFFPFPSLPFSHLIATAVYLLMSAAALLLPQQQLLELHKKKSMVTAAEVAIAKEQEKSSNNSCYYCLYCWLTAFLLSCCYCWTAPLSIVWRLQVEFRYMFMYGDDNFNLSLIQSSPKSDVPKDSLWPNLTNLHMWNFSNSCGYFLFLILCIMDMQLNQCNQINFPYRLTK